MRRLLAILALTVMGMFLLSNTAQAASDPTVMAFGASTTQGYCTIAGWNYPDRLSQALSKPVVNEGIAGDQLLKNTPSGPAGITRFATDLAANPSVKTVVVWLGTNDILNGATANQVIAGWQTLIRTAHSHHVKIIGATLQPTGATGTKEKYRNEANNWLRGKYSYPGPRFDAISDFDAVLKDPYHPNRMRSWVYGGHFTCTTHGIHPGSNGYWAVAMRADKTIAKV